jgi:hypothetical protein
MLRKFSPRWPRGMPTKSYRIEITLRAEKDRERVERYAAELETKSRRMFALSHAVLSLKSNWYLSPFYDRECGIRVCYVEGWYSVFFTVDESAERLVVLAILGQVEDLERLINDSEG